MNVKAKLGGLANCKPWTREDIAARAARDIPEGFYVNLGIGIPVLVANSIPPGREVVIQSENGILGMGPEPPPGAIDRWLINASKKYVSLMPGASYVHHADSFAMIRGGHLDLCVLGAFQVAMNGDFANWSKSATDMPSVGGAMDLAVGAREIRVIMEHTGKKGVPRILKRCNYPLTAAGCVKRIYTNLAVIDVTPQGLSVIEMIAGMTLEKLQALTEPRLQLASTWQALSAPEARAA